MKAVILAGGNGTRFGDVTKNRPKPMIEIGGKPIIWHIMKIYISHGINTFVICCGYKGDVIKKYFANHTLKKKHQTLQVIPIDTGETTMTGSRIKMIAKYIGKETFCLTYGDGLADIDISKLIAFHKKNKSLATVTAVHPPQTFGQLKIRKNGRVIDFAEKKASTSWINGGFFVLEPGIFKYLSDKNCVWEEEPLEKLAKDNQLIAYKHSGFWQCMDTVKDKNLLDQLWDKGEAPWKTWRD